jgi:sulfotransferase 6B1
MNDVLSRGLSNRSGLVRKGCALALRVPKWVRRLRTTQQDYLDGPPVLANSFPKSGTHLLDQIVTGLPGRTNFGAFLASMTSSFQFRERTVRSVKRFLAGIVPGEIIRGHLFYDDAYLADLARKNVVHYFIYRDPRDVVASEAHYLREMNRWHRLSPYFHRLPSLEDAISLCINGFDPPIPELYFPNIRERFCRYERWLGYDNCLPVRFEELRSDELPNVVRRMAEFYAARTTTLFDVDECSAAMRRAIAPERSHTFHRGIKGGWREKFTPEHRRRFAELAGELLIRLGYETDDSWVGESPNPVQVN